MTSEQRTICEYINSLAGTGDNPRIEFKLEKDITSDIKLRTVYLDGKFFGYHADLLEMARQSNPNRR